MDAHLHARATELFTRALEIPADYRAGFIERESAGDEELAGLALYLLANHTEGSLSRYFNPANSNTTLDELKPGDTVHNYRIMSLLGSGGMGVVYRAEQLAPVRRHVALKILRVGMDTRELLARFDAERQALALMDHPAIARVFDAGATDRGRPYFVMEFVDGVAITEYCNRRNMEVPARLRLFVEVCNGVQHAHQRGIIHRDIKPSNVLVGEYGGFPQPKIIDFGIARATNQSLTDQTLHTRQGVMLGTPSYMSPEQAEMGGPPDTRADVYSLGALLYELLTDRPPFEFRDQTIDTIRNTIASVDPARPSARLSALDTTRQMSIATQRQSDPKRLIALLRSDLDWIVMRALEKDRSRRYDSASELATDVERYLHGEPVVARPPTIRYQVRKYVRRHRYLVVGTAAVVAALVAGLAATMWQAREARNRLTALQSAASSMVNQLHAYHDVPSTLASRRELAAYASQLLDEMGEVDVRDTEAARQLASALEALGRLQADFYSQSTGEYEAGIKNLIRANDIRTELFRRDPQNELLATELLNARYLYAAMAGPKEEYLADAIAIGERFISPDTSNSALALNLSLLYDRAAVKNDFGGDMRAARSFDDLSFRLRYRMASRLPNDLGWARHLAVSYRLFAVTQTDYAKAEDYAHRSLDISQRLANVQPFSYRALFDLSSAHRVCSDVLRWHGRFDEALPHLHECLRIRRTLVRQDQQNMRGRHYLALALHEIGEVHLAAGDVDSALFYHSAGARMQYHIADLTSANWWTDALAWSDLQLARTTDAQGQFDSSLVWYQRALPRLYPGIPWAPLERLMAWRYLDEYAHVMERAGRETAADSLHWYSGVLVDSLAAVLQHSPCGEAHEDVVCAYVHLALELADDPDRAYQLMAMARDNANRYLGHEHALTRRVHDLDEAIERCGSNRIVLHDVVAAAKARPDSFRVAQVLYFQSTPLWGLNAWPRILSTGDGDYKSPQ